MTPLQAFNALIAGKFQRYCEPGKFRVYWEDGRARVEMFGNQKLRPLNE